MEINLILCYNSQLKVIFSIESDCIRRVARRMWGCNNIHDWPAREFMEQSQQLALRQDFTRCFVCFNKSENMERPCLDIYGFIM